MIGFIGLGQLGSRLAALLVEAGHDVVVLDTSDAAMQGLIDESVFRDRRQREEMLRLSQHYNVKKRITAKQ